MRSHEDLIIWKESLELVKLTYRQTANFPDEERFILVNHLRKSAISILSNIAEGAGRGSPNEFIRFLNISQGSLAELHAQFIVSKELEYIRDLDEVNTLIFRLRKMISALIKSLKKPRTD